MAPPQRGRGASRGAGSSSRGRGGRGGARGGASFSRGRGRGGSRMDAKKTSGQHLKKEKTKYHREKFQRDRESNANNGARSQQEHHRKSRSDRTHDVDISLAAKVSSDLRHDISQFRAKGSNLDPFGKNLNSVFAFVPPPFVMQHLPDQVTPFRTYMSKFQRGAQNNVSAFISWYEWASYEANKGKSFNSTPSNSGGHSDKHKTEADEEVAAAKADEKELNAEAASGKKMSQSRQVMAQTLRERAHVRALLQMCIRHNSARRREGQHAFINHLKAKLAEDEVDCRSLDRLRATAHHSVTYALSRLILGMATEDFSMIVLHCQALYLVLTETPISAAVIISLVEEELALAARMKAVRLRLEAKHNGKSRSDAADEDDVAAALNALDGEDVVDPDDINDPTKGERNQRVTAGVFALAAVVASKVALSSEDARRTATFLCFSYVQQKATRVLSANCLLMLVERTPQLLKDDEAMQWATFAFFFFPKVEYFRPEAVQFLLRLMETPAEQRPSDRCLPPTVTAYAALDPLQPATLEQLVNALFRKEQVTAVHPMIHPIWDDLLNLVVRRCAAGESMKEHFTTIVHTAIAPYRRGNADLPRRVLFQGLVTRLGQLVVQSADAEQRAEMLHIASKSVGYGKRTAAKPTPLVELRQMPITGLTHKVADLLQQYRTTRDSDPAATTNRTWVLRELRNCVYVPVRAGVECSYVDDTARAMLQYGFFPPGNSRDEQSKNRCIYLFADVFSFTFSGSFARPKCGLSGLDVIAAYLAAEQKGCTRYTTAVSQKPFLKARNRIVEALEKSNGRSVLFYEGRDMEILLTLLFLMMSADDPSNSDAVNIARSVVPDLAQFYLTGTLDTIDLLIDVLMALIMRTSSPLQVMPLMTCARRIATGYILKFARFIRTKSALDLVLAPLRQAFNTDSRELARQRRAKAGQGEDSDEDDEDDDIAAAEEDADEETQEENGKDEDAASAAEDSDSDNDSSSSEDDDNGTEGDGSEAEDDDTDAEDSNDGEVEEEEDEFVEEDEAPTQQYIDALKGMVGSVDLDHSYPLDVANKEKSDVVRAVQLAARVGLAMQSSLVVQIYQVLLAVCRENVKSSDDVIFCSAVSSMEMLLMTKNRYFGHFLHPEELFQLLGDIQSYSRKLERSLASGKDGAALTTSKAAALARRRLAQLKGLSIRVFHFVCMLAYKNHAGEDVRITLSEYYKSIFCDRGWDMKRVMPGLKKDLYHYRQGFAWAILPAAFEKFDELAAVDGPQRVRVFMGCCELVEAMLSRLSGLPAELKKRGAAAICGFIQSVTVKQVYTMKHTAPYAYLHAVKMIVQYNNRVHLDTQWVTREVVEVAVDDDSIQLSAASIRILGALEHLLEITPRARATKAPVPVKVLYQQFVSAGAKERANFYRKGKKVRAKILKAILAHRNDDPTDEERSRKRRRREELKMEDRLQRQTLRDSRNKDLTKEERQERRNHLLRAKEERIAKNRERKRRLHEARKMSFERWRQAKLAAAAAGRSASAEDDVDDGDE